MSAVGGPFKAKRMRITVIENLTGTTHVLGVVEGMDMRMIKEGGVVPHYDSEQGKHAVGTKHGTFRIRRWYKDDAGKGRLLFDLFNNETLFNLAGQITVKSGYPAGGSRLELSGCLIYEYGPVTAGANDIVSEEARGEAVSWLETEGGEYLSDE